MTAPAVLLLPASSALADAKSSTSTQTQQKPTYAELQKAAADADKAYKDAVAAKDAAQKKLKATLAEMQQDSNPLKAAGLAADKAAEAAAADKITADKAVTDAKAKLDAAKDDTEKAATQKAYEAAEAKAKKAAEAKGAADAKRKAAWDAVDDVQVAAFREYGKAQHAPDNALKAKEAADKALASAKECVYPSGLTVFANGLPSKTVAGSTVDFSLTVTNGTDRTLDVRSWVLFNLETESEDHFIKMQWSDGSGWKELDQKGNNYTAPIKAMKPGAHSDVKMRMTIEAGASAGKARTLFAADASDQYNPCVLGTMQRYQVEVLPAGSKPGKVDEAKPGKVDEKDRPKSNPSAQGGKSDKPVPGTKDDASAKPASTNADGSLASTGSSNAMPIAAASGAAVLLGAGAVFAVRRRRAKGTN
ncbi:LPXTG cell wall anchor domain-containing protein [Streptomyces gamaensis]|uniref:LPXTG cell wall anchor domain-containing protein n=1 Tax=Streptomyces gamaensis TaxID=1763542 RepID=A0ABW0YSS8_9ACTN